MLQKDTIINEGLWVSKPHRIIMTYENFSLEKMDGTNDDAIYITKFNMTPNYALSA